VTVEQLASLTPRQRQVMTLRLAGLSQAEIAAKLVVGNNAVAQAEYQARKRLGCPPRRVYVLRTKCRRGHSKGLGERCSECFAAAEDRKKQARDHRSPWNATGLAVCQFGHQKPRGRACLECTRVANASERIEPTAYARVARELAAGKRCTHKMWSGRPCGLLLPCVHP